LIGASSIIFSYACNLAAFSQDGGVPFPAFVSRISPGSSVPTNATAVLGISGGLLLVVGLSPVASELIYSLSVVMAIVNYMIPNILVLCFPARFVRGPFHCGRWTAPVFMWAVASQVFLILIESIPLSKNWTAATFNYQWVIALGSMLLVGFMWFMIGPDFKGVSASQVRLASERRYSLEHEAEGLGQDRAV
jgi:amino acid transporter